jgi:hypothetical protein
MIEMLYCREGAGRPAVQCGPARDPRVSENACERARLPCSDRLELGLPDGPWI